jgi:two-component system cell cycle sensor histidine kinase/response regulator CckA
MYQKWNDEASLRKAAEQTVMAQPVVDRGRSREALLYELLLHQTELKMQNEALAEGQAELRASHARYKEFFDKAPVGYVVLDRESKITAVNERAAELLGHPRKALAGVRFTRFLVGDEAVPFERFRREVALSETRLNAEFTMTTAEGEREIRIEGSCSDPERGEWCLALSDVTAYNSMVRRIDHDARLAATERHASKVAHELNNLLYSIQGHADIALRFLEPGAPAYAPVTHLQAVADRCAEATERLSAFSRAEARTPAIVDLNAVLADKEPLLRSLLGEDLELSLELGATDSAVRVDAEQLEQILLSCTKNARQAMPFGGTLRIETANVDVAAPRASRGASARYVRWTLTDSGVGMDDDTRQRAFDPFFTTKPPGVGTGLGLAMVKATVERASGFIELESHLGRGTTIVIHLPRATGMSQFPPATCLVNGTGP